MQHLIFNMVTLFFFGRSVEVIFGLLGQHMLFPFLYLSGIVVAGLPGYYKYRTNPYYAALGASGGVSAVIFASIYYQPWGTINFIIPSILFAVLYIAYSYRMAKNGNDNIGHDAHMWGAIYGFVFAFLIDPSHGQYFIEQMNHPVLLNHPF
jgi:membrane associated rhomboid family serine protease